MNQKVKSTKAKLLALNDFLVSKEILLSILIVIGLVATGLFLGFENNRVVPPNTDMAAHYTQEPNNPLSFMSDWDGPIYLQIAHQGYKTLDQTAFFPMYPALIHMASLVVHSPLDCALAISWISLVLAIYFYIKIIKHLFKANNNLAALRAALYFILFPSGVVLIATYTESLFAFLALGAIYYALRKKYLPAALLTMLATATHINGVFVLILVALLLYEQREKILNIILTLVIGSLGILIYMGFLYAYFKNPFEFILSQKTNGWLHSGYLNHLLASFSVLDLIAIVLIALSVFYWWKRRKSFSIYSALYLLIPIAGGQFNGFDRYALMAFPFQFMLYDRLRYHKYAYMISIALLGVFWGYFLLQYAGGYTGAGG